MIPENWQVLQAHEHALVFPLIPLDKLRETFPTMWETGYDEKEPITLYEGKILDGRNRWRAAIEAEVTPTFESFDGTDDEAQDYSVRRNKDRRHLTDEQRVLIAAKLKPYYTKRLAKEKADAVLDQPREDGKFARTDVGVSAHIGDTEKRERPSRRARDLAAAEFKVPARSVDEAAFLENNDPELYAKVEAGEMKLWPAADLARERKKAGGAPGDPIPQSIIDRKVAMDKARAACRYTNNLVKQAREREQAEASGELPSPPARSKEDHLREIGIAMDRVHSREDVQTIILAAVVDWSEENRQSLAVAITRMGE